MENITLKYKKWYSINNVCSVLNASLKDIQDLLDNDDLQLYGKLERHELLAYKYNPVSKKYLGKAKLIYSGVVSIKNSEFTNIINEKAIETKVVSILRSGTIHSIVTRNKFPEWIYESLLTEWEGMNNNETIYDFRCCDFPYKKQTIFGFVASLELPQFDNSDNPDSFKNRMKSGKLGYHVETELKFDDNNIVFSRIEIERIINGSPQLEKLKSDYPWYLSFKRKNKFNKVIELLYTHNKKSSTKELWEILRLDSDANADYDPDNLIDEVGAEAIYFLSGKPYNYRSFANLVSKCRVFYKNLM